jgi:Bacterial Ig-like domain (group 1)
VLLFSSTPLQSDVVRSAQYPDMRELMPHSMPLSVWRALAVLLTGVVGCTSDILLPDSPGAGQAIGALTKEKGDGQSGPVGEMLPAPLVVKVVTQSDEPASGVEVTFALVEPAGGTVDPTATTNIDGEARANWTLGTVPGTYSVRARLSGVEVADSITEFQAIAHAADPDALSALPPLDQPGQRQVPVEHAPTVKVVDRFGNPVPDAHVAWLVTYGEGQVTSATTVTDADGKARVDWTLGNRIGVHKLTATVEGASGSPALFTATVFF